MKTKTKHERRDAAVQGKDVEQVLEQKSLLSILDINLSHSVPPASAACVKSWGHMSLADECWLSASSHEDAKQMGHGLKIELHTAPKFTILRAEIFQAGDKS